MDSGWIGLCAALLAAAPGFAFAEGAEEAADPYVAAQHAVYGQVLERLAAQDWDAVRERIDAYTASDQLNPHVGHMLADELLLRPPLLETAAALNASSAAANSVERLALLHPGMGTEEKLKLTFRNLHIQRAWIAWKQGERQRAMESVRQAAGRREVRFVFVLNKPELAAKAEALFARHNIQNSLIGRLTVGSAYDLIAGEPATWIVDQEGFVVERHRGYEEGDEEKYRRELSELTGVGN
jgi:hypothetical protein